VIPLFSDAMSLRSVAGLPGRYGANLNEHWTIGPKVHGGVMVALCAKAGRAAYHDSGGDPAAYAVAVSANFLSAPNPGEVLLHTAVRKRGRRIGLVDVELVQGERACVHAVVTLGEPEHRDGPGGEPLMSSRAVTELMAPEPPADVIAIGPDHPAAKINTLSHGCHIHPQIQDSLIGGGAPVFKTWVRPKAEPVDELFALVCGDISLPVSYAAGRPGWAPTVQLTAYLRGLPADGWLRVLCTATEIGQDWFDEDHTVVDSTGRIVVQTRQLALVPGL
jgi:hypothetical protein